MKRLQAEKSSMEQSNDQWLWFVDDELVEALARHDVLDPQSQKRAVQSAALAKALSLNMEGKTEQALREIATAIENGEALPELDWTKAHLEFQLGQYEAALEDYGKVLAAYPNHRAGIYNSALVPGKTAALRAGRGSVSQGGANVSATWPRPRSAWGSRCSICNVWTTHWRPSKNA